MELVQVVIVQVQNLYMLQLVQVNLYKLQLVQAVFTSCNLYRFLVKVATCTKSQLVHNVYNTSFKMLGKKTSALQYLTKVYMPEDREWGQYRYTQMFTR